MKEKEKEITAEEKVLQYFADNIGLYPATRLRQGMIAAELEVNINVIDHVSRSLAAGLMTFPEPSTPEACGLKPMEPSSKPKTKEPSSKP